jgi:hypothetical protein
LSVHVSSWAWKQEIGDDGAKLVLLKLADSANDYGVSFPGKDKLLIECEVGHDDTLRRRLRKLRELELILPVPWFFSADSRQTSSTYILPFNGVPSAERLWQLIEQAPRKGVPGITREELLAAEAVGTFVRGGGATLHPLVTGWGDADAPPGGAQEHPPIEEPFVGTGELRSPLPADADEGKWTRLDLMAAFAEARGVDMAKLTRKERRQWELAADDLVDVDASPADVAACWAAWPWPNAVVTPLGIVGHWSLLSANVELAKSSGFDGWLEQAPSRFSREMAHEIVDDAHFDDPAEATRRHRLVDELYDRIEHERSDAA